MKINVIVFVRLSEVSEVTFVQAHSQGVNYYPIDYALANGMHRFTFQVEGDEDTTPALEIRVSDGIRAGEKIGG